MTRFENYQAVSRKQLEGASMGNVVRFEEGKQYYCVSPCNTDSVWVFTAVRVTARSVTLEGDFPSGEKRKRLRIYESSSNHVGRIEQFCKPLGNYSMAPILRAMCTVKKYGKFYE